MKAGATLTKHDIDRTHKFDWEIDGFAGMDNSSDPSSLPNNISPNTLNNVYDLTGATETRKGYTKLITHSFPGPVINQHPFYKSDGTRTLIFAADATDASTAPGGLVGTYLCKYDNAGGYTVIGGPYTINTFWDFTTINDKVYACNGVEGLLSSVGADFTVANAVVLQYIENRKNRLYGLVGSLLKFSDAGDPDSWPANNYIQINTNDNQTGVGLKKYFDDLVIGKTQSVWYLQGEPLGAGANTTIGNLQLRQADSEVGWTSVLNVKKIRRGVLMWVCESGVAVMQNYHVVILSEKIENTFKNDVNPNFFNKVWAVYSPPEKKYIFGYPSSGSSTPDKAMLVDLSDPQRIKFAPWDHYPGSCACLFRFTYRDSVLIGHPTKGYITQAFQGYADIAGDNGQATGGGNSQVITPDTNVSTNHILNPSFEVDKTGWTDGGDDSTLVRTAGGSLDNFSLQITNSSGSGANAVSANLLPSTVYTLSFYLKGTGNLGSGAGNIDIEANRGASNMVSTTVNPPDDGTWQRYSWTFTTDAAAGVPLGIFISPLGDGSAVYLDNVQLEQAPSATSWFDGDTAPGAGYVYSWTGTAGDSTSVRTLPAVIGTTLEDTSKGWTTDQFKDADVTIVGGTGAGQQRTITGNNNDRLVLSTAWGTPPDATSVYSIGAYTSLVDTPVEDFGKSAYDKKVKYFNIFGDSHANENLLFGSATGYQQLSFSDKKSLAGGGLVWGQIDPDTSVRMRWGKPGLKWGRRKQVFLQYEIGLVDKHFQARWGNNRALQPWRVSKYSVTLKFKKVRPDVV